MRQSSEENSERRGDRRRFAGPRRYRVLLLVLISIPVLCGCSDNATTRPMSTQERQEAALKDPFAYTPNGERPDVSGGDTRNFDKDGFKRDLDHVFNP